MEDFEWDVIVIGGGAAGLSAALMLGRARRRVLVIDSGSPRNRFASHMHGVLGNEGTNPATLLERGRTEAAGYGVQFVSRAVDRVDPTETGVLVVAGGETHSARAVIVATGLTDELAPIPGLAQRWGRTVLHCPYCHGWEVRDQRLGVVTTSPLGLHQAELVRQWSDQITVFTAGLGDLEPEIEHRLRARGIELVASPVVEVVGDGEQISSVRTEDGREIAVDAIFTAGTPRPHDELLSHLDLDRVHGPMGSFLHVHPGGKTSADRIWAVGNVVSPMDTVPMAIGAGSFTGAAVNAALVTEEFDAAVTAEHSSAEPAEFWEEFYLQEDRVWSGTPNPSLVHVVSDIATGRALDLGCGEGADAIWLARNGWSVTGVDISSTAIDRALAASVAAGLPPERARFVCADLSDWAPQESFDLVTATFLHAPVALQRTGILRSAASYVADGGHILIVSHAAAPNAHGHEPQFLSPEEEVAALGLPLDEWHVVRAETRSRPATGRAAMDHDTLDDVIVLLRRTGHA